MGQLGKITKGTSLFLRVTPDKTQDDGVGDAEVENTPETMISTLRDSGSYLDR